MTYKIIFHLDPTQAPSFVHTPLFDGILYGLFVREKLGDSFIQKTHYTEEELYPSTDLPINRYENGIFKASQGFYESEGETVTNLNQHWHGLNEELADFGKNNRGVHKGKGTYKSNRTPTLRIHTSKMIFYVDTDDIEQIKYLLENNLKGIGKKNSLGWGTIESWEIEESDKDFDKELLRPLPISFLPTLTTECKIARSFMRVQPPYFLKQNFEVCRRPK